MNRLLPPFSYRTTEPENDGGYVPERSEMAEQDDTDLVVEVEEANIYSTPLGQNPNSPHDRKVKILTATKNPRDQKSREVKECREINVTFRERHNPPQRMLRSVTGLTTKL